ncbi:MAG TPA: hypothetical protein DCZ00_03355 [Lactococcus sp.]|uniref:Uncharacterized protein n=1 Tax=Lactococcus muris TaxID=2941330 RepID=A0ABV4D835_9LACT|nr:MULTISPECIES: hypothetical protein [Lactococcus]MBL3716307.1 hypothetical protein [Lactococcus garvieae]HBC90463.1 hypothetical protein [Lactococcus sp.]
MPKISEEQQETSLKEMTQLQVEIEQLFQAESDRIINDIEEDASNKKLIATLIAVSLAIAMIIPLIMRLF